MNYELAMKERKTLEDLMKLNPSWVNYDEIDLTNLSDFIETLNLSYTQHDELLILIAKYKGE